MRIVRRRVILSIREGVRWSRVLIGIFLRGVRSCCYVVGNGNWETRLRAERHGIKAAVQGV
ncbi:MAG: hypothetical protein ACJA16_005199 [Akkermansiaceae bacterium]|jgi:hypothetical protein